MKTERLLTMLPVVLGIVGLICTGGVLAMDNPSVVVHFDTGKAFLSVEDKNKIRDLFSKYELVPQSRVFILGYTDNRGDHKRNYALSRQRAQSVHREIVSAFGVDAAIVMAMGKGEDNPVADNGNVSGQSLNRRAEVFLANARERTPERQYGADDPYLPQIRSLVSSADHQIRQGKLDQALKTLQQAHALGGDHYSDWHAAYGILGYFANAPLGKVRSHLKSALRLDPHNYTAREFLSRVHARRKLDNGEVNPSMGRTAQTAIPVSTIAQEHEFLRQFNVTPLAHKTAGSQAVDIWECLDAGGQPVTYYFDYSGIYTWAFGRKSKQAAVGDPSSAPEPQADAAPLATLLEAASLEGPNTGGSRIWESTVFK
jgi:hypothetical protein